MVIYKKKIVIRIYLLGDFVMKVGFWIELPSQMNASQAIQIISYVTLKLSLLFTYDVDCDSF